MEMNTAHDTGSRAFCSPGPKRIIDTDGQAWELTPLRKDERGEVFEARARYAPNAYPGTKAYEEAMVGAVRRRPLTGPDAPSAEKGHPLPLMPDGTEYDPARYKRKTVIDFMSEALTDLAQSIDPNDLKPADEDETELCPYAGHPELFTAKFGKHVSEWLRCPYCGKKLKP